MLPQPGLCLRCWCWLLFPQSILSPHICWGWWGCAPQLDTEMLHLVTKFCVFLQPFWRKDLSQVCSTAMSHQGLSRSSRERSCSHSVGGTLCQTLVCFLLLHVVLALLSTTKTVRSPQHRLMDSTHPKSRVSNRASKGHSWVVPRVVESPETSMANSRSQFPWFYKIRFQAANT